MKFTTHRFDRIEGDKGQTVEFRTEAGLGGSATLAYIDYSEDGTQAAVQLFDPAAPMRGRANYPSRPADKAEGIVNRHLHKLGYNEPIDAAEQPVDNEIMERALSTRFKLQMTRKRMKQSDGILSIDVVVGFDGIILFTARTDGRGLLVVRLDGRTLVRQTELDRHAAWELSEANIKSLDHAIKRADEAAQPAQTDDADYDVVPHVCPRCGINPLNRTNPVFNSLSRVAPVYICNQCGNHEAMLDYYGPRDPDADPLNKWVSPRRARAALAAKQQRLSDEYKPQTRLPEDSFAARVMTDAERAQPPRGQISEAPGQAYVPSQWPDSAARA